MKFSIPILVIILSVYPLIFVNSFVETHFIRWVVLIGLSLFALFVIIRNGLFSFNKCSVPLALFLFFIMASAAFSNYPLEAWLGELSYRHTGFITYLCLAVLFTLAYSVAKNSHETELEKIITIWLFSVSIIAIIGILQFFGLNLVPDGSGHQISKSYSTIGHWNHFGTYMLMALPFAAIRFLQKPSFMPVVFLSLVYGSIITSLCRGAYVGLAVGLIVLFAFYPKKPNLPKFVLVITLITAVLLPVNNWMILNQLGTAQSEVELAIAGDPMTGSWRFLFWSESVKALPGSLLIGTGPDTLRYISEEKFDESHFENYPAKAHNIYLEIWVTMGLPALLSCLWFLRRCSVNTNRGNPLHFAFMLMVVIYLVQGVFLVDVITVYPLFWIMLGFYAGTTDSTGLNHHTKTSNPATVVA